jgi:23S rRNA U2552 (ribose-2'-O)-methylase RlmE/FtsJ
VLGVQPGDKVLDLCAAPGGKATRIGSAMMGQGLLVANEINEDRSRALLRNIELFGIRNAVITNESPSQLEKKFPAYFDKILIDAPCSGEGMFRRDPHATKSWERFGPAACEKIQKEILISAHHMLASGGHIVYATCTFNTRENEDMIDWFLHAYPEYSVIAHPEIKGVTQSSGQSFSGSMRIWPHVSRGEGHFCVHLMNTAASEDNTSRVDYPMRRNDPSRQFTSRSAKEALLSFAKIVCTDAAYESFVNRVELQFLLHGDKIHLLPVSDLLFDGCKVVKMGDFPGEVRTTPQGRIFIPSHAFALTLAKADVRDDHVLTFARDDARCMRYLRGETIMLQEAECSHLASNAYVLICIDSYPIGWGKSNGASLKNLYPKAWRIQ